MAITPEAQAAYDEAVATNKAYDAELIRVYGPTGSHCERYMISANKATPELRRLHAAKEAAWNHYRPFIGNLAYTAKQAG